MSRRRVGSIFGYDPVALTTRPVEICLGARTMPEIDSKITIETPEL